MQRSRTGRYSRRREQEPQRDAVFSAMMAQITICLILLVFAYCIKLSGLPVYETARTNVAALLETQLEFGPFTAMMERLNLRMPVLAPKEEASGEEQEISTSKESEPVVSEAEKPTSVLDEELASLVEQYLPDDAAAMADATGERVVSEEGDKTPVPPKDTGIEELLGQGGGITPVQFTATTGDKVRITPPVGTTLAPFYLTLQPVLPVKLGTLTSRFGYRLHPVTGEDDFHTGVDIAAPAGTSIGAVLPGTVSEIGVSPYYGNFIVLTHSTGLKTLYGHCSEILAPPGAVIRQYETIARVGKTGMTTGNHVHLEFLVGGIQADPAWVYDEF